MGVAGQSAGAHCALMLATTFGDPQFDDLSLGNPKEKSDFLCVLSQYTITDLTTLSSQYKENKLEFPLPFPSDVEDKGSLIALMFGGKSLSKVDPARVKNSSPLKLLTRSMPPALIHHGKMDGIVPYQQSVAFFEKAKNILGADKVTLELFDTAVHADKQFETKQNMERVRVFFDKYLK